MALARDLTDMEFGLLKAIERTEKRENRYYVWHCECKCGGEAYVSTKHLLRGTVTNCGCIPKSTARRGRIAENLKGRHFGEWEVLYRSENRNEKVMWTCRCSCGTLRDIPARDLKKGKTRSCQGTIHNLPHSRRDLTGKTFGGLKVLHVTNQRDYKGSVMWHCKCAKCGGEKNFSEDALVHKGYKSCGCDQYSFGKELPKRLHYHNGTSLEAIALDRKVRSDSKSGVIGVYEQKNGTYCSGITFQGKKYYLGKFQTLGAASIAYRRAKKTLHGGFIKAYNAWVESGKEEELIFDVNYIDGEFLIKSNYLPEEEVNTEKPDKRSLHRSIRYMSNKQTKDVGECISV